MVSSSHAQPDVAIGDAGVLGGYGYVGEYQVERLWRDARLFRFAPISEEMILNYISVHELGMARGY